ncbi:MAG: inorganic phosphate transporter, partial [Halobaculum sp.]
MVGVGTLGLLAVAGVASFATAWTIGAGSSGATPFAPAVGANAASTMRAAFVVGLLGFLGAVLQGGAVTETVGGELVGGVALGPVAATVALTTAAALIAIGVFTGYPIATAFVVSGAVVGVGLALGGRPAFAVWAEIVAFWLLTPFVGVPVAYATARLLRGDRVPERLSVPALAAVVGAVVANMGFSLLGEAGEAASLALVVARAVAPAVPPAVAVLATTLAVAFLTAVPVYRQAVRDPVAAQR